MTIAPVVPVSHEAAERPQIAALLRGFSLEATRPRLADIEALRDVAPAGSDVYLSAVPGHALDEAVVPAAALRAAGFEPVPHIAVRNFDSTDALDRLLGELAKRARVKRVLVIGGDRDRPAGPFHAAVEVIDSGLLQRHGIGEIGIAGYPDGHPRLPSLELDRALAAKIEAAEQSGLKLSIVTQFCFSAEAIVRWLTRLRDLGIDHPVRIGLAGPTNLASLLKYAQRCGVKASTLGLARQTGLARHMFGMAAPDTIVRPLAEACAGNQLGGVALHFFGFGGPVATARWASAVAAGSFGLTGTDGFRVDA
jgi:methylenetetrahydrofolate reductase (NADPH)